MSVLFTDGELLMPKKIRTVLVVFALTAALLGLGACKGESSGGLAKAGSHNVSQQEFDAYLAHKRIKLRDQAHADKVLKDYVERDALAQAIESQALLNTDAIDTELAEFKKEMLISRYFERFLSDRIGIDAVTNYYGEHAEEYAERKAHVAHILVRTSRRTTETERAAKRVKIQEAHSKLGTGADFAKIAEAYSEDKVSGPKGGDLGWVKEGSIHPVFSKTAFEIATGQVSPVFETSFGFHVLKVIEEPKVIRKPLKAVEGDIRYQLRAKAKGAEMDRLNGLVTTSFEPGAYPWEASVAVETKP